MNLNRTAEWVKGRLPPVPESTVEMKVLDEDNVLTENARIDKVGDVLAAKIMIFVSKNLLSRSGAEVAVKAVLVHEFCHLVHPFNPDKVTKKHFPSIWKTWRKAQRANALECDASIERIKFR